VQHNCHAILLAQANALALVHCIQNAEVNLFFVLKAETRQKIYWAMATRLKQRLKRTQSI